MKKIVFLSVKVQLLAMFFVFAILLQGCSKNKSNQKLRKVSLRLPIPIVDAAFAPLYLAQDKGFFSKHGLSVKLEPGSAVLNPTKMVAQGINEFGIVGGPELLMTARAKGAPIKGFALLHKDSNFVVILTHKNSNLTKIQELNGGKVGFFYGHISTDVLRSLFAKEKVKVTEVDVGFNYNLFIANKLKAQWAFRPTAGLRLPQKGIKVNEISPADYGIITQGFTFITSEKNIKETPELVKKFLAALVEATNYSLNHKEQAITSILKRNKNFNREIAEKQLAIYNKVIKNNSKTCWIASSVLEATKKRLIEQKLLSSDFDLQKSIDISFVKKYYSK